MDTDKEKTPVEDETEVPPVAVKDDGTEESAQVDEEEEEQQGEEEGEGQGEQREWQEVQEQPQLDLAVSVDLMRLMFLLIYFTGLMRLMFVFIHLFYRVFFRSSSCKVSVFLSDCDVINNCLFRPRAAAGYAGYDS